MKRDYWIGLALSIAVLLLLAWPAPYCYANGYTVKWLSDRGFVCWVERNREGG